MIPRYQFVLLSLLVGASIAMGAVLWHLRDRAHQRLLAGEVTTPTQAPQVAPVEQATLFVANDQDGSLQPRVLSLPLPSGSSERARTILGKLMELYAAQGSSHAVTGGASAIAQVFLLPQGKLPSTPGAETAAAESQTAPELAVVNLTGGFAASHPSGIQVETLTLLSICATLHANLPRITEVRFLVDGQPRETLAGHADLSRTYLTSDLNSAASSAPSALAP